MNQQDKAPEPVAPDEILRGFEVVRWDAISQSWEHVSAWRATELALRQAAQDVKWLNDRHPDEDYRIRALVSVPRRDPPKTDDAPLKLDSDENPAPATE